MTDRMDTQSAREVVEAALRSTNSTSGGWKADEKAREALAFLVAKIEECVGCANNLPTIQAERDRLREGLHAMAGAMRDTMDERDRLRAALEEVYVLARPGGARAHRDELEVLDHITDVVSRALSNPTATTEPLMCCRDDRFDIEARQERDRLRAALYEREEALRAIEAMRDDAPLTVARNIALTALSNPTTSRAD